MAIIQTLSFNQFVREFVEYGREDQFSMGALRLIYDYLSELENVELDVIGICGDFVECDSEEAINSYDVEVEDEELLDYEEVARQMGRYTTVLGVTDDEEAPTVVFVSY